MHAASMVVDHSDPTEYLAYFFSKEMHFVDNSQASTWKISGRNVLQLLVLVASGPRSRVPAHHQLTGPAEQPAGQLTARPASRLCTRQQTADTGHCFSCFSSAPATSARTSVFRSVLLRAMLIRCCPRNGICAAAISASRLT